MRNIWKTAEYKRDLIKPNQKFFREIATLYLKEFPLQQEGGKSTHDTRGQNFKIKQEITETQPESSQLIHDNVHIVWIEAIKC